MVFVALFGLIVPHLEHGVNKMKLEGKFVTKIKQPDNLKDLLLSLIGTPINLRTKKYVNKKLKEYDMEVVELRTDGVIFKDLRTGWEFVYLGEKENV